jgi:hypothetical protein
MRLRNADKPRQRTLCQFTVPHAGPKGFEQGISKIAKKHEGFLKFYRRREKSPGL